MYLTEFFHFLTIHAVFIFLLTNTLSTRNKNRYLFSYDTTCCASFRITGRLRLKFPELSSKDKRRILIEKAITFWLELQRHCKHTNNNNKPTKQAVLPPHSNALVELNAKTSNWKCQETYLPNYFLAWPGLRVKAKGTWHEVKQIMMFIMNFDLGKLFQSNIKISNPWSSLVKQVTHWLARYLLYSAKGFFRLKSTKDQVVICWKGKLSGKLVSPLTRAHQTLLQVEQQLDMLS